jgi:Ca2+-binding RTX toxin-like protein
LATTSSPGGTGDDLLLGGAGVDIADYSTAPGAVSVNLTSRFATGADGTDTLIAIEQARGGAGNDRLVGSTLANALFGMAGNDTLSAGRSNDILGGGRGNDILVGSSGIDLADYSDATARVTVNLATGRSSGALGLDRLSSIEQVRSGRGHDTLIGNGLSNNLDAGVGNDRLVGNAGNDVLTGGLGRDVMTGGRGADQFMFTLVNVSNSAASNDSVRGARRDVITDFSHAQRDKINLSAIDADIDGTRGNQRFTFIGDDAFSGIDGQLRFANGVVQGDVNGNRIADFEIRVGVSNLVASDFVL